MGGVSPHHPTKGLGERCKLFQRVPGWSPGRKWILCIFEVRKKPSRPPFSVFLSDGGAPKTSQGPGKLSPSPPLSRQAWLFMLADPYINQLLQLLCTPHFGSIVQSYLLAHSRLQCHALFLYDFLMLSPSDLCRLGAKNCI